MPPKKKQKTNIAWWAPTVSGVMNRERGSRTLLPAIRRFNAADPPPLPAITRYNAATNIQAYYRGRRSRRYHAPHMEPITPMQRVAGGSYWSDYWNEL